jgi:hypothetical protein
MSRFREILVLSLLVAGCGGDANDTLKSAGGTSGTQNVTLGGADSTPGVGGSNAVDQGGAGGSTSGSAGASSQAGSDQGGTGGSDVIPQGGSDQGGAGGSDPIDQGGAGGSVGGQGGSDQAGTGGSDQGGTGGTDQGGTGGSGGSDVDPVPECDYQGGTCTGLLYQGCDYGEYDEYQCQLNCVDNIGCYGSCANGDTRCTGETVETCVDYEWAVSNQCPFQCVNGACEGACTPGTVVCEGTSTATCGSDFHYGSPVACPTHPFGVTSCSAGICGLTPVACDSGTADCDGNWSCESSLSSTTTCGACNVACPSVTNATATCDGVSCGFSCNDGFADCDGNAANGCEQNISTNALNCGACGSSCYGTTCDAGQCEFDFEVVSDYSGDGTVVNNLTVSATHVYWLTQRELRRAPKAGGEYETLATLAGTTGLTRPVVVVEAGKVCWAASDGVYTMLETGGTPTRIFATTNLTSVTGLVGANGKLYWNDSQVESGNNCITPSTFNDQNAFLTCSQSHRTTFRTYDLGTHSFSSWQLSGSEYSPPLAVVGNEMFVGDYQANFAGNAGYEIRLSAFNATTGASLRQIGGTLRHNGTFNSAQIQLLGTAVSAGTMVYSGLFHGGDVRDAIVTAPLTGGDQLLTNKLISTVLSGELAADATTVYYLEGGNFTSVQAVSLTGVPLEPIFHGETAEGMQIALDDTYVYFTAYANGGERAILRAPK